MISKNIKCLSVIPARAQSTRLPGKVLKDIDGKSLIQRVWEQAKKAEKITKLIIATDDDVVFKLAQSFGAEVMMTSEEHTAGSFRVEEAYSILAQKGENFDVVVNVQGDMPFISPQVIDAAIDSLLQADISFGMSTIARPIILLDEFLKTSAVKVAVGENNRALYFSRSPIPYARDGFNEKDINENAPYGYKHIGLYVFRPQTLVELSTLSPSKCEEIEKLEQLRALAHGIKINVCILPSSLIEPSIEVDTAEDLRMAIEYAKGLN